MLPRTSSVSSNNKFFSIGSLLLAFVSLLSSSHATPVFNFTVGWMLDVISTPMNDLKDNHQVSCWMDITRGQFPNSKPIEGSVKVGENLTMAIYIKDKKESTDIRVKDCYAYDAREDAVRGGKPITIMMLTSDQGCPLNNKVMDYWKTTTSTGSSGASVVAYTTISAFKFPEKESVFLTCNVELCTNGCLTFCNDDTSRSHTLSPAFNANDHNSPVHRHLTNVSFVTTRVSTTTPSAINFEKEDERERESDRDVLLDPDIRRRKNPRIHRISIRPASHETEEAEDVDVILNGDVNPKADFARLVFQGTDTSMTSGESEGEPKVGNLQDASTTINPDESETSTPGIASTTASDDESEKQSTTQSSATTTTSETSAATTTLTPATNDTLVTTTSPLDTTTQSSSDLEARTTQASDATETTTGKTADLQQSKQSNITESDSQKRGREGKSRSQELDDDKDNNSDDILSIKPVFNGGIKGGTKGGSSSLERRAKNSSLRKYPAFLPRPPAASARRRAKKEDRIGSSVSSSSRSSSSRRRNSSSNRNRRRDASRRNRNKSNNNNRRRKLVSQASSRDASFSSRNSGVGWRMEPLPSNLDPGYSDIPFRASRQSRRYARPPWNQSFSSSQSSSPVSSYHRRA